MAGTAQSVISWAACSVLESDPDKMGGEWVFRGTRVPYTLILDEISTSSIDDILENYPTVKRQQILDFFEFIARSTKPR
jgi:uncharacterized protein (DUF433 family)